MDKTYLGDAVYVDTWLVDGIKLTTWDGINDTNTIFLEPFVVKALLDYIRTYRDTLLSPECR